VPGPVPAAPGAAAVPAAPARRQLALVNGSAHLDVEEHPRLGPAQAPHVVALLFDYTCSSCRAMHPYLVQARQRYGAQLAVVLLPVPMDPACNPFVQTARPGHENACRYARLALAVWKVSPAAFEAFHQWLMEPAEVPALAAAHDRAAELVGAEALDRALADGELDRQLATICRVYEAAGKGLIPKLVYDRGTATGKPAHAQELFDFFEKVVGARGPVR
jgi:protein-disulfide isomerase